MPRSVVVAVETSSRVGSVALGDTEQLWASESFSGPMRHAAECLPTLQALLDHHDRSSADISEIRLAIGPGSFTGLRIAVALAKSMSLAGGVRIVAVPTLDVMVANLGATPAAPAAVALLDAKRGQFYAAGYRWSAGRWRKVLPESILTAEQLLEGFVREHAPVICLGDALVYHRERFSAPDTVIAEESTWSPRAEHVFHLGRELAAAGRFSDPWTLKPLYLREPQVTLKRR